MIDSSKLSDISTSSPALKIFDERLLYLELPILIGGLAPGTEYNLTVTGLVRHCPNGDENLVYSRLICTGLTHSFRSSLNPKKLKKRSS